MINKILIRPFLGHLASAGSIVSSITGGMLLYIVPFVSGRDPYFLRSSSPSLPRLLPFPAQSLRWHNAALYFTHCVHSARILKRSGSTTKRGASKQDAGSTHSGSRTATTSATTCNGDSAGSSRDAESRSSQSGGVGVLKLRVGCYKECQSWWRLSIAGQGLQVRL